MASVVESLPLPNVSSPPSSNTENQAPVSPPTGTSTPAPAANSQAPPPSDSITCGQCSQKFYHVTQFLQHKSTCPGEVGAAEKETDESCLAETTTTTTPIENAYLCAECPSTVYPSSDLLRLHLLDSHGVYLPAGTDMGPVLQETKAYQVHPDQARKMATRAQPTFQAEVTHAASDCSSEEQNSEGQAEKEVDSGNDSDIKKDFSAGNLSNSPNGSAGNSSGNCVDSGNSEMRSPAAQSVQPSPLKPENPTTLPQLPSTMARSLLESMVANRLRANLEQKNNASSASSTPTAQEPGKLPVASALNHLFQNPVYQHGLMPFQTNPLQAQFIQAQQAALQQATQVRAAQAAAAQAAQQQNAALQQTSPSNADGNLYQPAVKRRRRGYGSEVGTENLKILRDGEGYCCPLCNYKSRVRSNLTIHLRTHTGYKPYKCPYCPYSSSQSGPLKIHIRGHTGEKPYRCDYCSYASTCRGNLKVHQERHHKEEIAKHGLNAGIKGPNDMDEKPLAIEDVEMPPVSSSSSPAPTGPPPPTMPPTSSAAAMANFANNLRVPPLLPGIPGMGGHMNPFGLGSFGGQMNPNLLAGLLKPKTDVGQSMPHFPLNITGQSAEPQVTEVKEEKMDA